MRGYQLHESSWTRIVTHRVRRPTVISLRLGSRRRREHPIPVDGRLVLIAANQVHDPRTGAAVDRRELLDRIVEALSVPEVDGVVGSADVLEELTLLNVLERRLAVCSGPGEKSGLSASAITRSHFDAAQLATCGATPMRIADEVATLQAAGLPTLIDVIRPDDDPRSEWDTPWQEWVEPMRAATAALSTGPGVWLSLPAINGMSTLAAQTAFPVLVRDADVPIDPAAWQALFEQPLPITVRGMIAGPSALFPLDGSVAEATGRIAAAGRASLAA